MHLTLHLTTSCNLNCSYCYSPPATGGMEMTREIIDQSLTFAIREFDTNIGVIFFGGEPLLRKDLIEYAIVKCKSMEQEEHHRFNFHFKTTTNGVLLDKDFLEFSRVAGLNIGLSIDGTQQAHDVNRKFRNGEGSFQHLDKSIDRLLQLQPCANAMMVVTPENVQWYAASVNYLVTRGFRYIIASLNYDGKWENSHLKVLEKQYKKIAVLYKKWTLAEKKFYFSPFEMKFANHIRGNEDDCYSCQLSKRQISIAPDGRIYPCVQFVKDGISNTGYSIGNIFDGFDSNRETLFSRSVEEKEACSACALKKRCYNTCSCLNWQTTGYINTVSPLLCETEQMLIPIVDRLGEELFKRRSPMFIQKQYNIAYPLLSMLEDEQNFVN